jgi:hypothetical protein
MKQFITVIIYLLLTYAGFAFANWDWLWITQLPDWNVYERLMLMIWTILVFPLFYLMCWEFPK